MRSLRVGVVLSLLAIAMPAFAQQDIVAQERAAYGAVVTADQAPVLLTAIARRLSGGPWGLLVKTSGNNCGGYGCDIVCNAQGEHFDVLTDGPGDGQPGPSGPSWQPKGPYAPRICSYVTAAPPPPPPPPPPAMVDFAPVLLELSALRVSVAAVQVAAVAAGKDAQAATAEAKAAHEEIVEHRKEVKGFIEKHWPKFASGAFGAFLAYLSTRKSSSSTSSSSSPGAAK